MKSSATRRDPNGKAVRNSHQGAASSCPANLMTDDAAEGENHRTANSSIAAARDPISLSAEPETYFEDDDDVSFSSAAPSFGSEVSSSGEDEGGDTRYYNHEYADYFQDEEEEDDSENDGYLEYDYLDPSSSSGVGGMAEKGELFTIMHDLDDADDDPLGQINENGEIRMDFHDSSGIEQKSFRQLSAQYNFYGFELVPETMKRSSNRGSNSSGSSCPRPSKQMPIQLPNVMEEVSSDEDEVDQNAPYTHQSSLKKSVRFIPDISASYYDPESFDVLTPQQLAFRLAKERQAMSESQRNLQLQQHHAAEKEEPSSRLTKLKRSSFGALGAAAHRLKGMVTAGDKANSVEIGKDVAVQNPDSLAVQTLNQTTAGGGGAVATQNDPIDPRAIVESNVDSEQERDYDNSEMNQSVDFSNTKQQFLDSLERADKFDDCQQVGEITYDAARVIKEERTLNGAFQFKEVVRSFRKTLERGEKIEEYHSGTEAAYDTSLFVQETTSANGGRFDLLQTIKTFKEGVERGEAIEGYSETGQMASDVHNVVTENYDTHGTFNMKDAFNSFRNTLERGDNANAATDVVDEVVDNGGLLIMNQGGGGGGMGAGGGGGGGAGAGAQTQSAQAAQATQAMAVQAAGNAASGAAAATSATATAAATAAGATAAAATVSTATAVGVATGVAVAAVASGFVTMPSTPITTIEDAVGCHPNFTVACSDVEITFLPGSRITPDREWEAFFFEVYNSISPQCNEKYQRILQNVTLTSDEEADGVLYTTWNGCVSCWPYCPTDALFGDDGPIVYDVNSSQVIEDIDENSTSLEFKSLDNATERKLQVEDVFGDAFTLSFLEFIQETQVELIALKKDQGVPEEELPTVGILQGELPESDTIVLLEEKSDGEVQFVQIAATPSPTTSTEPSSTPTASPSEGPPPGSYVFQETLSLTFHSAYGQELSPSEISALEKAIVNSFQSAVDGSADFSRESLNMLGATVVSQSLSADGPSIIIKATATFVSENGSVVALNIVSEESAALFEAYEEALAAEIASEESGLAESLTVGPSVTAEDASTSFTEELSLTFDSTDGEALAATEIAALEEAILESFQSTVFGSDDFSADSLSMVGVTIVSQILSDDGSSILIVAEATFVSENGGVIALNLLSEESSALFDAFEAALGESIAGEDSELSESITGVPIISSDSASTSFSEELSIEFESANGQELSTSDAAALEAAILASFQEAVLGSENFSSDVLTMTDVSITSQTVSSDGSSIAILATAIFVSENGSVVALNMGSAESSALFDAYEAELTAMIESGEYGLSDSIAGGPIITSDNSSTSFIEELRFSLGTVDGQSLSDQEILSLEEAIRASFAAAVDDPATEFSSDSLTIVSVEIISQDGNGPTLDIVAAATFLSSDGSVIALNFGSEESNALFTVYEAELTTIIENPDSSLSDSLTGSVSISVDSSSTSFTEELSMTFPSATGEALSEAELSSLKSAILQSFQAALSDPDIAYSSESMTMVGVTITSQEMSADGSSLIITVEAAFLSQDGSVVALNLGSEETSSLFEAYENELTSAVESPDSDLSQSLAGGPSITSDSASTSFTETLSMSFLSASGAELSNAELGQLEAAILDSFQTAISDPSSSYSSESLSMVGVTIISQALSEDGTSVIVVAEALFLSEDGTTVALNVNSVDTSSLFDIYESEVSTAIKDPASILSDSLSGGLYVTASSSSTSFTQPLTFSFESLDGAVLSGTEIVSLERAILDSFQEAVLDGTTAYNSDNLAMLDVSVTSQTLSADGEILTVNTDATFLSEDGSVVALNLGSLDTLILLDTQEAVLSSLLKTSGSGLSTSLLDQVSIGSESPSTSFTEELSVVFASVDGELLSETEVSMLEQAIIQSFRAAVSASSSFTDESLSLANIQITGQAANQENFSITVDAVATFVSSDGTVFALNTGDSEIITLFDSQEAELAVIISADTSGLTQSIGSHPVINSGSASISFTEELSFVFPSIDGSKLSSLEKNNLEQLIVASFRGAVRKSNSFGSETLIMASARIGSQSVSDDKSTLSVLATATFVSSDGSVLALNLDSTAVLELLGLQEQELASLIVSDNTSLSTTIASQVAINSESSSVSFTEALTFTFPSTDRRQLNWEEQRNLEKYIIQSFQTAVSGSSEFTYDTLFMARAVIDSQEISSDRTSLVVKATTSFVSSDGSIFALNMGSAETLALLDQQEIELAVLVVSDISMADSIPGEVLINSDSTSASFKEEIALAFPSSGTTLTSVEVNSLELAIKGTFATTVEGSAGYNSESLAIARVELRSQTTQTSRRLQSDATSSESGSTAELIVAGDAIFLSLDGSVPQLDFGNRETTNLFLQLETDLWNIVADPALGFANTLLGKPVISFPALFSPSPTQSPTEGPTFSPSAQPSTQPSVSAYPSMDPSNIPTNIPSDTPSTSLVPSVSPTDEPSTSPSVSSMPTATPRPSTSPSASPAPTQTSAPTMTPTASHMPSMDPTASPSAMPSSSPSSCLHNTTCIEGRKPCTGSDPFCAWTNSCNGNFACRNAPALDAQEDACRGVSACEGAAGASVGDGSCVDEDGNGRACRNLVNGIISSNSCRGREACADTTSVSLIVGSNSCLGYGACRDIKKKRRSFNTTIGDNSCRGERACEEFAGLSIGANSCNCFECCACWNWRYPGRPFLDDVIPDNSCNVLGECCPMSSAPSATPSASPSDAPSSTPSAQPSDVPSASPSDQPSDVPSASPSDRPSSTPSASPSDRPSAMPSDAPSPMPTGLTSMSGSWDPWTPWDGYFSRTGNGLLCGIDTMHDNGREDRTFRFRWCRPNHPHTMGPTNGGSSGYVNWYDQAFTYSCPGDSFIQRFTSVHDNGTEDRRFAFDCQTIDNHEPTGCYWTSEMNNWDSNRYYASNEYLIQGISSYHSNEKEDRRFKYRLCQLYNNGPGG